jgi:hypothetical protein
MIESFFFEDGEGAFVKLNGNHHRSVIYERLCPISEGMDVDDFLVS